jgi:hypothetical protein
LFFLGEGVALFGRGEIRRAEVVATTSGKKPEKSGAIE